MLVILKIEGHGKTACELAEQASKSIGRSFGERVFR